MECVICEGSQWHSTNYFYNRPDKYEKWLKIKKVARQWGKCTTCGHHQQQYNYSTKIFDKIYKEGYRDITLRGKTLRDTFETIIHLPTQQSENKKRIHWLENTVGWMQWHTHGRILDIGSGFGVFPYELRKKGYEVHCIEPNRDSRNFIIEELGFPCREKLDENHRNYDVVSIVHVLEHVQDPEQFLLDAKKALVNHGTMYIEAPDSIEFTYLRKAHDEFCSLHMHFFDAAGLYRLVEKAGLHVTDIHRSRYHDRDLSRIQLLARNVKK